MMRTNALAPAAALGALLSAWLCAGMTGSAVAATRAGVTLPDTMQVGGATLVLNGIGVRSYTILQIRGYVGGLYLPRKSSDVDTILNQPYPKVLVIHYVHSGSAAQMNRVYMESSRNYCAHHACTEADRTDFMTLLTAIRPVQPGDSSSFVMTDRGVQVLLNGQQLAMIPDAGFGRVILESDLGPTAPSAELRNGLLGLPD